MHWRLVPKWPKIALIVLRFFPYSPLDLIKSYTFSRIFFIKKNHRNFPILHLKFDKYKRIPLKYCLLFFVRGEEIIRRGYFFNMLSANEYWICYLERQLGFGGARQQSESGREVVGLSTFSGLNKNMIQIFMEIITQKDVILRPFVTFLMQFVPFPFVDFLPQSLFFIFDSATNSPPPPLPIVFCIIYIPENLKLPLS